MMAAIWLLHAVWGDWRYIGQPYTPGYPKVYRASEVWYSFTAILFFTGVSGCMIWTALRGNLTPLSARVQIFAIVGLSMLWAACLVAAFTVVNEVDTLAPAVLLIIGLCPICVLVLLARLRRKVKT
jgi:hypothetical protein